MNSNLSSVKSNFRIRVIGFSVLAIAKTTNSKFALRRSTSRAATLALLAIWVSLYSLPLVAQENKQRLEISIVDADTLQPVASRLYLKNENDEWFYFESASSEGNAVIYDRARGKNNASSEFHTSVSAHPVQVELLPGNYELTVERGKEYFTQTVPIAITNAPVTQAIKLKRWINASQFGWYSGDTHVHRPPSELPTAMLAEDLNVCMPLTYWVTEAFEKPADSPHNLKGMEATELIEIDPTHVIYPRNTEYEIFRVGTLAHELGALFLLNHKSVLDVGVPPIGPVIKKARSEGALLELDKHNWPWSMAIAASHQVDLFELSNNHIWRSNFDIEHFGESPSDSMNVETTLTGGFTERGWIDFGFENYYALLNCGLRMRPTGGTANGVHPVPLGFGRVYVHLPDGFSYQKWIAGLDAGRSFVTTGPMLFATMNGNDAGGVLEMKNTDDHNFHFEVNVTADGPVDRIEMIVNGEVVKRITPDNDETDAGAFSSSAELDFAKSESFWACFRVYQKIANARWRFAHSAPFHVEVDGQPVIPRTADAQYLVDRVQSQIDRSRDVLPAEAISEYQKALEFYEECLKRSRSNNPGNK